MKLNIQDTFNRLLPADRDTSNTRRQVTKACYSLATPRKPSAPELMHVSPEMLAAIGLSAADAASPEFLAVFSGAQVLEGTQPFAMCYGGHQFGHWAGQLGDGRAINLFEVVHASKRWALQLKGAGETPYSRNADGLAVLRSSVREHLCSEAMHHLGVPTTRSLSLVRTGDQVLRDMLYDGHPEYEHGAVVCRVSPSFIRFGNFEILASRKDIATLRALTDYTIEQFFPHINLGEEKAAYLQFYKELVDRTIEMVVHWQRVGFVHGVMNTDNMSILGLTIDYGPYGWLEGYDPNWTPNTTDAREHRYRFGNQPYIALWNLVQLGNALYPLIEDIPAMEAILNTFNPNYQQQYRAMMCQKLGIPAGVENNFALVEHLVEHLQLVETDMTIFFRLLANVSKNDDKDSAFQKVQGAFYAPLSLTKDNKSAWLFWFEQYLEVLKAEIQSDETRKREMNATNPKYVLRNYMAQLAIDKANEGDYTLVSELYELLKKPYDEQPKNEKWFALRPDWARTKVGCSQLSCSS